MADMEHEQCYKSAITITEPPGQHTEYTRRGELRHPGLARDAARGSSRSRAPSEASGLMSALRVRGGGTGR